MGGAPPTPEGPHFLLLLPPPAPLPLPPPPPTPPPPPPSWPPGAPPIYINPPNLPKTTPFFFFSLLSSWAVVFPHSQY
ncbi:hypothetical protein DSO57_1037285 [Entomophthora muscae]|uniref:Uncharacterized protein n=1 Tax=Entomophthora muscae TaxID=34485 RepID=A0ACC2RPY5_9FUNG|nr:hypothetical protein DSO57_1037285 [Entomophthora muscae]